MKRRDIENAKRPPAKPLDWRSGYTWLAVAVLVVFTFGLYPGALVGVAGGAAFAFLGVRILFTVFGPYESGLLPWLVPLQATGRAALGLLLAFLGGLTLVSATADWRPSLIWEQPRFGDLRTVFWNEERFAAMACEHVDGGPPAALEFALERGPRRRIVCANGSSLMELAETDEAIDLLLSRGQADQQDLDRKLVSLAWQNRRLAIESLVAAGANPNAVIGDRTALSTAIENYQSLLAAWLLEHGAQANQTFSDGRTLLSLAENLDQIEQREAYVELLLRHGAAEPPRLEQALPGRRASR